MKFMKRERKQGTMYLILIDFTSVPFCICCRNREKGEKYLVDGGGEMTKRGIKNLTGFEVKSLATLFKM